MPHEVKVFSNIELGLDMQKTNTDKPNSRFELYNRVGYIGIAHAEYGKAQFGRIYMPVDSVAKSNLGYIVKRLNFDYIINMSYSLDFRRKVLAIKKAKT